MKKTCLMMTLAAVAAASQASFTLATFADPSMNGNSPMFRWDKTAGTLSGSWNSPGLNMETPGFIGGGAQSDISVSFDTVQLTTVIPNSLYTFTGGQARFYTDNPAAPFLTATFDGGTFLAHSAIVATALSGNNVKFTGANLPPDMIEEEFAFSLANSHVTATGETYTASFTSSADVVPEPSAMIMLVFGISAMIRRRRSQA